MNNTMIGAMAGTSSPSKLAPETVKIRNALIEKYADQPIEELNEFLQRALEVEKDELKRLGLLAARVYILRQKVLSLKAFIRDERLESLPTPNLALTEQILLEETANSDIDNADGTISTGEWHSLQMIEPGEVNGVRFFQGTVINAKAEDAEKLIASGKAIFIDDDGNPVENNAASKPDSSDNTDALESEADAVDEAATVDASDKSIAPDDENNNDSNPEDAKQSVDSTDTNDTLEQNAGDVDQLAAVDNTDNGINSDGDNTNDSNSGDAKDSDDRTDNIDKPGPQSEANDEVAAVDASDNSIVPDDENNNGSDSVGPIEDINLESTENTDVDDSDKTKA